MTAPTVFTQLCDLVDELQRVVRDLPHSPQQLALEALVDRFDVLIDSTIGLEVPAVEDEGATPDADHACDEPRRECRRDATPTRRSAGSIAEAYARRKEPPPMPEHPTPGQRCYEAYTAALTLSFPRRWADVSLTVQAAWEAAAEAVRAHRTMDTHGCPVCGARDLASRPPGLTAGGEVHRDMTCEDCAATWVDVYTYAEARYVQALEEDDHA